MPVADGTYTAQGQDGACALRSGPRLAALALAASLLVNGGCPRPACVAKTALLGTLLLAMLSAPAVQNRQELRETRGAGTEPGAPHAAVG